MDEVDERSARSIARWLRQGACDFLATWTISIGFSAIFVLIGLAAFTVLYRLDQALVIYPLLTGFVLVAPILLTGFQRVACRLRRAETVGFADLLRGIAEATPGIWFLSFFLVLCYLIWVTDALILYGIYFGFQLIPLDAGLLEDGALRQQLFTYLMFSALMGLGMALIGFAVAAFSIPLIMHRRLPFVSAVHQSVVTVLRNPGLMLRWALTLAGLMFLALGLLLPLLVVLPVLAFASHAAYAELFPEQVD